MYIFKFFAFFFYVAFATAWWNKDEYKVLNEQKPRYKGSQIYIRDHCTPEETPLAEKIIIPERCTWPYLPHLH